MCSGPGAMADIVVINVTRLRPPGPATRPAQPSRLRSPHRRRSRSSSPGGRVIVGGVVSAAGCGERPGGRDVIVDRAGPQDGRLAPGTRGRMGARVVPPPRIRSDGSRISTIGSSPWLRNVTGRGRIWLFSRIGGGTYDRHGRPDVPDRALPRLRSPARPPRRFERKAACAADATGERRASTALRAGLDPAVDLADVRVTSQFPSRCRGRFSVGWAVASTRASTSPPLVTRTLPLDRSSRPRTWSESIRAPPRAWPRSSCCAMRAALEAGAPMAR